MKLVFTEDSLTMTVDAAERSELARIREDDRDRFDRDDTMHELFENLTTNDEFIWLPEGITADLTSAPMLAIMGRDELAPRRLRRDPEDTLGTGLYVTGSTGKQFICQPVLFRWGFMDYAVTSPQRELLERGKAVWYGGEYVMRHGNSLPRPREVSLKTPSYV